MIILLNAVTATGAGTAHYVGDWLRPLRAVPKTFSVVVVYAGAAPTACTLKLQGSHDGTSWIDMGNTTDVSATVVGFAVADKPYSYIMGNITAYTAGSCTGVTATCEMGS